MSKNSHSPVPPIQSQVITNFLIFPDFPLLDISFEWESYNTWLLLLASFIYQCFQGLFIMQNVLASLLNNISLYGYAYMHILFIHSSVARHLGFPFFLTIMNNAAMNLYIQLFYGYMFLFISSIFYTYQ